MNIFVRLILGFVSAIVALYALGFLFFTTGSSVIVTLLLVLMLFTSTAVVVLCVKSPAKKP